MRQRFNRIFLLRSTLRNQEMLKTIGTYLITTKIKLDVISHIITQIQTKFNVKKLNVFGAKNLWNKSICNDFEAKKKNKKL